MIQVCRASFEIALRAAIAWGVSPRCCTQIELGAIPPLELSVAKSRSPLPRLLAADQQYHNQFAVIGKQIGGEG